MDPLSGHKMIVAGERSSRPGGKPRFPAPTPIDVERDPFAEGHEDRTPPSSMRCGRAAGKAERTGLERAGGPRTYIRRSSPTRRQPEPRTLSRTCSRQRPAVGAHEVIVNAPESVLSLAELPPERLADAMEAWRERMRAHADCAYVQLIVNERREGGASLEHTHSQLYALDFVPRRGRARARALWRLRDANDGTGAC